MCIPEGDECPINEMIVDSSSKYNEYESNEYSYVHLTNLSEDYFLYYTNQKTDNEIIVKYNFSNEVPRYINEDNFILDKDNYDSYLNVNEMEDEEGYGGDGNGGDGFGDLNEDNEITKYIKGKFNEDINIDKSYKKIFDNLYVGNYIGFKDYTNMNKFNNMDLYESYFTVFPNAISYIFCYFSLVAMFGLTIFSVCRIFVEDIPNERKIIIICIYMTFFISYFIYCLYEYFNIYKNRNPENLMNIRADFFIENLLNDIYKRHNDKIYIFSIIILLSCSVFINIIAWISSIIYTKTYMALLKNATN